MKWIGQHIVDSIAKFRSTVDFSKDVTFYQPVNNADPNISIGASDDERLKIGILYEGTTTQTAQIVNFTTRTESGVAHDGRFHFSVDGTHILRIQDNGINLEENMGISINGTDILTDSSGTATLSNIDALDATTIATIEAAVETNIDTLEVPEGLTIDTNRSAAQGNAGAENITALHVDFDRTVPTSGTHNHRDVGIDLDVTSAGLGTQSSKGMDIDVVGTADGTSTATGIDLTVSGADVNNGISVLCNGEQLRLSNNATEYATFKVSSSGDLEIETVGSGTTDSDLTLNADGRIFLEPAAGTCKVTSTVTSSASEGAKLSLVSNDGAALGNDHRLAKIGFQSAEDGSGTIREGASIQAYADAAWSDTVNDSRLEFYTMDGNNNAELSLTLDSNLLATFAGAVTVTGALTGTLATASQTNITELGTIDVGAWQGTAIASAYMASATDSAKGAVELATTAESDTGTDTARAVTPEGLKSHVDARYSYAYMTWSASASPTRDGSDNPEWMLPNTSKGIYEEDWNNDSGITSTTTGTTTYTLSRLHAANSLILPQAGILVGFHAIGRNSDSDLTFKAGLFHAANGSGSTGIDYGATGSSHDFTLRCVATAVETEASGGTDGTTGHSFKGPCKLISNTANLAVATGDALMPAIMGNDSNSTDEIFVTMTIVLKIPLA